MSALDESATDPALPDLKSFKRSFAPSRRKETLAKFELFRSLSAQAIAELDTQCIWRKYSRNEWIAAHHEANNDFFFILSGSVRLKIPSTIGREVLFQDLDAGSYFGEVDAIDGKPSATGVVAQTDAVIARMPRAVFLTAMHRYPDVGDLFLVRLAGIVRVLANRVREFSTLDVKHRIYAELLRLSRPKPGARDHAVISPPPVQAAIAARISTRRETVAREMKALERAGLIERKRGALLLNDTRRLQFMLRSVADCDKTDFDIDFL